MWTKAFVCSINLYKKCSGSESAPDAVRSRQKDMHSNKLPSHRTARTVAALLACACFWLIAGGSRAQDGATVFHWMPLPDAQVKLDDKIPLTWNVCQPEKKDKKDKKNANLVLILLGHRYLMLDLKTKNVYEVPVASLKPDGDHFDSGDLSDSPMVPVTEWTSRDIGPAELYQITLGDYGRTLIVQLSHPPDLRAFY
jgi:hypothetical protein